MARHLVQRLMLTISFLLMLLTGDVRSVSARQRIEVLPAGSVALIANPTPSLWALSGYEIARVRVTVGGLTPIMRTELWDARLVEILWAWQRQPQEWNRIEVIGGSIVVKLVGVDGVNIVVHRYLLMQVTQQDAWAAGTSVHALALEWAAAARHAMDRILLISRFGA